MNNKLLLQSIVVSSVLILSGCNSGNNSNNQNSSPANTSLATLESGAIVNGWPNYIAMGGVTNTAPGLDGLGGFSNRPVDAIFKYSGYDGAGDINQIVFPIFTINTVNLANSISVANQHRTKPVMVNYIANMSITASLADFSQSAITAHLINLMMDAAVMEANRSESNPYPGSLVLAPDLLGMMQQNSVMPVPSGLNSALKKAACFVSSKFQYGSFNGTPLEIGYYMRAQGMGWFDVKTYWELYAPGWLAACDTTKMSITVPAFSENFGGWAQASGWAIRTFGPHISYGWQENIWAPGSSWWIHQANSESTVETLASNSVAAFIRQLGIYQAPYQPDFIVFDRWERDDTIGIASGYYYNARDWENFINFSAQVGKKLGNVPVMLWQIPGGHLQVTNDIDTRSGMSSSFSNYIFGDDKLGDNLANLRSDLVGLSLNPSIYNCGTACTSKAYLNANGYKWNQDNGKLSELAAKGIFAILWGGGSTTSVGTFPSDDGGWLAGKIRNYYQNPQPLISISPQPTPSATPSPKPTVSPSPSPVPSPSPSVVPSPTPSPVPTVSPSPVPTQSPTPAPAKTGTVTITMPTVVSAYNGNLQVQLLNSKDSNAVVATYTVKQGASVTSGNLPISDTTHAYKVKLVSGIADPLNGVNYVESGTPTVAVKNGQNTAMTIPMKASTTAMRTVILVISGLQGSDKATIGFADANGKYSYQGYSGYGNGNAVFKIENNQSLTITVATAGSSYQSSSLSNSSTISKNQTITLAFTAKMQPSPSPSPTVAPSPSPSPIASPTPAPSPSPSGIQCSGYETWNTTGVYTFGNIVVYDGVVYKANWWTQGNNPALNNGGNGSGMPWTKESACQ